MSAEFRFAFGPFELDPAARRLFRDGEPVAMSGRHVELLCALVAKAGQIVTKDQLIQVGWGEIAVTDNSLEQVISSLRRVLDDPGGRQYIETQARRGYRFVAEVTRHERRETDAALDALLAPHRAWMEGRAALETLERTHIARARQVFEDVLTVAPAQASAHVGLANACVMQFEMTRADQRPDADALQKAAVHAREACRLDAGYGEAWATLGFVLERTGQHGDALAALRRAVTLEPDNWRHHVRLSYCSWGEERLRAARRALSLLPGFPMAHWLAATVYVARQANAEAERELAAGVAAMQQQAHVQTQFSAVALHWLTGLLALSRDDEDAALAAFARELTDEPSGQLYSRECCANTWYAIGAVHLRRGRFRDAVHAFTEARERIPAHLLAARGLLESRKGLGLTAPSDGAAALVAAATGHAAGVDAALVRAADLVLSGQPDEAARTIDAALADAPPGSAGWLLPVEPLLFVQSAPDVWAAPLGRLRARAV